MKVEDILGKKCYIYVRDLIDIYNINQEKDPFVLTKIFGHLYLKDNRFIFYFNWIKELDKKDIMYPYSKVLSKELPHGYNSFIELPGWRVAGNVAFLENEKVFSITAEELKEILNLPKDTLVQVIGDSCLGIMGYANGENYPHLFKPISKRIINI